MPTLNRTAFYKKLFIVAAVGLVLAVAVQSTFNMKYWMFGQTPFEYSFRLATTYSLNSAFATLERLSRSALAAVGFTHTDATASSNAPAQAIPVLTYHRIVNDGNDTSNVTVALFRDQMRKLKDAGWNTVTLKEFESYMRGERSLPEKSFLLTFDDGAKESFYPVDPILQSLGYNAVIFVIVQSSNTPKSTYYLSPQELTQMLRTGRWEIGSHSYDGHHPYLTNTGDNGIFFADKLWLTDQNRLETDQEFTDRVRADLTRAKSELNSTYGGPIDTFAFPLGNETGIAGAGNFPEGAAITTEVAKSIYKFGFLQGDYQEYTPNFPVASTSEQSMIAK